MSRTRPGGEKMEVNNSRIVEALSEVLLFRGDSQTFRHRIAAVEAAVIGENAAEAITSARSEGLTEGVLADSLLVKAASAQIDVVLHAAGIIAALPYVLEPGERIEYVSLGAGNTGRAHDLETDLRVAEFKFIKWQGGSEAVRQDSLLVDLFHLATTETSKRRVLYLTGTKVPLKFLNKSTRDLRKALARHPGVPKQFENFYGDVSPTVKDYWVSIRDRIEVVDLVGLIPEFESMGWNQ